MSKKIFVILSAAVFISGLAQPASAVMCLDHIKHMLSGGESHKEHKHSQANVSAPAAAKDAATNAGNKICPVSGEKIDEKLKATYEYKGKIYNFCCASCVEEFKKDPEKYIKKAEEELNAKDKVQK